MLKKNVFFKWLIPDSNMTYALYKIGYSVGYSTILIDCCAILCMITYSINIFPDTVHFSPCDTEILSDDTGK